MDILCIPMYDVSYGNLEVNASSNLSVNAYDNLKVNAYDNLKVNAFSSLEVNAFSSLEVNASSSLNKNSMELIQEMEIKSILDSIIDVVENNTYLEKNQLRYKQYAKTTQYNYRCSKWRVNLPRKLAVYYTGMACLTRLVKYNIAFENYVEPYEKNRKREKLWSKFIKKSNK
jgi:hypothetical protein